LARGHNIESLKYAKDKHVFADKHVFTALRRDEVKKKLRHDDDGVWARVRPERGCRGRGSPPGGSGASMFIDAKSLGFETHGINLKNIKRHHPSVTKVTKKGCGVFDLETNPLYPYMKEST
jgi:hypothetical protein